MMKIPTKSTKFSKTESKDPNQVAKWVTKIFTSRKWVMKASGWTCDLRISWLASRKVSRKDFLELHESRGESQKTLTLVFQHKTCLNNEKQSKH